MNNFFTSLHCTSRNTLLFYTCVELIVHHKGHCTKPSYKYASVLWHLPPYFNVFSTTQYMLVPLFEFSAFCSCHICKCRTSNALNSNRNLWFQCSNVPHPCSSKPPKKQSNSPLQANVELMHVEKKNTPQRY